MRRPPHVPSPGRAPRPQGWHDCRGCASARAAPSPSARWGCCIRWNGGVTPDAEGRHRGGSRDDKETNHASSTDEQDREEIADELGEHSKLGTNRERMLALVLNTFAKVADGVPTNDVDAIVVAAFDRAGWGERMRDHGRHDTKLSPRGREELFPGAFGALEKHADYSLDDLRRDLPDLDAAVRAMPNAVDIDVAGVHDGTAYPERLPTAQLGHASAGCERARLCSRA
jgi:hypothetical protein